MTGAIIAIIVVVVLLLLFLLAAVKVLREYERGIVFRLGRLLPEPKGPGPLHPDPDRRPDDQGRPADDHAERSRRRR